MTGFEITRIPEPKLVFADGEENKDPRAGLLEHGPCPISEKGGYRGRQRGYRREQSLNQQDGRTSPRDEVGNSEQREPKAMEAKLPRIRLEDGNRDRLPDAR